MTDVPALLDELRADGDELSGPDAGDARELEGAEDPAEAPLAELEVVADGDRATGEAYIRANNVWRLAVNGKPLVCREIHFRVTRILWWHKNPPNLDPNHAYAVREYRPGSGKAELGWKYPDAWKYQVVPSIGNTYFTGARAEAVARASQPGEVWFGPNDTLNGYGDNVGGFYVTLLGWK